MKERLVARTAAESENGPILLILGLAGSAETGYMPGK